MSSGALVLQCELEDYNSATGECAAPYYAVSPSAIPSLSIEDGVLIAGAIGSVWALGLVARILIRVQQLATNDNHP